MLAAGVAMQMLSETGHAMRHTAAAECDEMEQLQAQLSRATRAFLEQQERVNGSFASLAEARTAIEASEILESNLQQVRRRMLAHKDQHHCA
jgi:hypothetical protein